MSVSRFWFDLLSFTLHYGTSYCSPLPQCLKSPGIVIWALLTSHGNPFSTMAVNVLSPCYVREISPGTHTFFPTYTCSVYCWRSVQLLDFSLFGNLIHASQPIRISFTGQCFVSGFLQTPPHDDALALDCILPTAGRIWDFHPLERAPAGHTKKPKCFFRLRPSDLLPQSLLFFP